MWFIGVQVEQETSAPPPKKNPGSAIAPGDPMVTNELGGQALNAVFSFHTFLCTREVCTLIRICQLLVDAVEKKKQTYLVNLLQR